MIKETDSGQFFGTPLTYLIFAPLLGALIMMCVPKKDEAVHKVLALGTSLVTFGIGIYTMATFNYDKAADMQFDVNLPWISAINSRYILGLDGISLPMLALTLFIVRSASSTAGTTSRSPRTPRRSSSSSSSSRRG